MVIGKSEEKENEQKNDIKSIEVFCKITSKKPKVIETLLKLSEIDINMKLSLQEYDKSRDGIGILEKYNHDNQCAVCDTPDIDVEELLIKKQKQTEIFISALPSNYKEIINLIEADDSKEFNQLLKLKERLNYFFSNRDFTIIKKIQEEIQEYIVDFNKVLNNIYISTFDNNLVSLVEEYEKLIEEEINFDDEDSLLLQEIVSDCIGRSIRLERQNNDYKLLLDDTEIIGSDIKNLKLSTGEENFISLSFEIIKAKNVNSKIIVIDDPISSFDSIYKNKIAYLLLKCLNDKNVIILTHNVDLLKLLHFQKKQSFNLYMYNNTDGGNNGFIRVIDEEQKFLLSIKDFLNFLRNNSKLEELIDEDEKKEAFLLGLIPFMRGYANIVGDNDSYKKLSKLMHGYESDIVDVGNIFDKLFSKESSFYPSFNVSTQVIINRYSTENYEELYSYSGYPLLSQTLKHSFSYLALRIMVEKTLYDKFQTAKEFVNQKKLDNNFATTTEIIWKAFGSNSREDIINKSFFMSRKTLINEFNHFEGNMNIFQPAIDITNQALEKEKTSIELKLMSL